MPLILSATPRTSEFAERIFAVGGVIRTAPDGTVEVDYNDDHEAEVDAAFAALAQIS